MKEEVMTNEQMNTILKMVEIIIEKSKDKEDALEQIRKLIKEAKD